jgi:hypothetical protein
MTFWSGVVTKLTVQRQGLRGSRSVKSIQAPLIVTDAFTQSTKSILILGMHKNSLC